jgi:DNA-directed RNA polymerase I, II, and III subunit RPABC2
MSKVKKVKQLKEESEADTDVDSEINESIYDEELDEELDETLEDQLEDPNDNEQNECMVEKIIEDDNDFIDIFNDNDIKNVNDEILLNKNERISHNRLTKYEMVRILGERTKQLTLGAKPLIKNYQSLSYDKIAEEELKLNMIPYKIKRLLPNNKYEIWTLDELKKDHLLYYLN